MVGEVHRMKIAALVHFYMPWRCAGSETVAHELLKAAVEAGHDVRVWCTHKDADRQWSGLEPDTMLDGVRVTRVRNAIRGRAQVQAWRPKVLLSHHQHTLIALKSAKAIDARSVFCVHNDMDLNKPLLRMRPDLVIFNADWVRESLSRFGTPRESMTFHPPVTPDRHCVLNTGDAITLVNLNRDKGAELFYALAEAEPDRQFLGVVGGHGPQVIRKRLPNVTIHPHTPNMAQVWSQTRILLMPSIYESYGLVAQEAGLNGIPTIANPTPGLLENLGKGGLFADRDRLEEWRTQLRRLDSTTAYNKASDYALERANQAMDDTRDTLKRWVEWIG